jgi:hypothetical protein
MPKKMIVATALVFGFAGSVSVALADPPGEEVFIHGSGESFEADFAIDVEDPCLFVSVRPFSGTSHGSGELDVGIFVAFFYWDFEEGTLVAGNQFDAIGDFEGDLQSASVSFETTISSFQCDPAPSCFSLRENCIPMEPEPIVVDLVWTGIGKFERLHSHGQLNEDDVAIHGQELTFFRDATVDGMISAEGVGLEFTFEGEEGFLTQRRAAFVQIGEADDS